MCDSLQRAVRAAATTYIDVYEAAIRAVTEAEWLLARGAVSEPIRLLVSAWADMTRDVSAVQLSTARWVLDL